MACVLAMVALCGVAALAQEAPVPADPMVEITPELDESVALGLTFLASQQNPDGSFGDGAWGRGIAVTSLAALAFMADGQMPDRGQHGEVIRKALEYVLDRSGESGLLADDQAPSPMYGHGFAALFLGEVYGMSGGDEAQRERLHEALVKAVRLIERSQNDEGGWRYNPVPTDADVSVTICQVMALRSARNAGIEVSSEVIDNAVDYVKRCQNPDGGFRYQERNGSSAWPRSAAGVATLYYAGEFTDEAIDPGVNYLIREALPGQGLRRGYFYYGHYYAVQAMFLAGGDAWRTWWPAARRELIDLQDGNGAWPDRTVGTAYGTAMALIVLQMPKRYLPIYQK
ncbi:MAG: terpene cyclase/mutase family protein [Phycisphaera sp.]|nr:MAG: terpene cyclase/mutase family protein [Phycisphaera sp.]